MPDAKRLVALLGLGLFLVNWGGWAAPGRLRTSLTVVPPGPVTDRIEVELRLGLGTNETARVSFYWDSPDPANLIGHQTLSASGGRRLAQLWARTCGRTGKHRLLAIVRQGGVEAARSEWPLQVIASQTRALPLLSAGWLDLLGLSQSVYPRNREATAQDLRATVDAMHHVGMDTAIITYSEYQGHFFYPSALSFADRDTHREAKGQWFDFDAVEAILSQADSNSMHVFLGLGRGGDTDLMAHGLTDPERLQAAIRTSQAVAAELWQRYRHHRSFYGWYATHEMNSLAASSAYYDPVADFCHGLCPDKPFMVAPDGTPLTDGDSPQPQPGRYLLLPGRGRHRVCAGQVHLGSRATNGPAHGPLHRLSGPSPGHPQAPLG